MTTTKRFGGRPKPLSRLFEGKLLILDMDGTSLDSELLVVATWLKVFARLDPKRKLTLRELEAFSGPPLLDSCRKCFPDRDPLEVEKLYIEEADPLYPTLANLFPGEREALAQLKENGCKLAINSNKLHAQAVMALEEQGIASLFDAVVAGGDAPTKPDPAGVNRILKELGIEKENAVPVKTVDRLVDNDEPRRWDGRRHRIVDRIDQLQRLQVCCWNSRKNPIFGHFDHTN